MEKNSPDTAITANIPESVMKSTALNAQEKMLFGVIASLEEAQYKTVFAKNKFFAAIFNVCERTIQRWLHHLKVTGFITCIFKRLSRTHLSRTIFTCKGISRKTFTLVPPQLLKIRKRAAVLVTSVIYSQALIYKKTKKGETLFSPKDLRKRTGLSQKALGNATKQATEEQWLFPFNEAFEPPRAWATGQYIIPLKVKIPKS